MKQCIASASAISNALKISGVDDEDDYDDPLEDSPFSSSEIDTKLLTVLTESVNESE